MYWIFNFFKVLKLLLQKGKIYLFFLLFSILIFSSFIVLISGIRNAINKTVEESIGSKLPPDIIKVTPKIVSKTIFSGNIKGAEIRNNDYLKISRLKGVKRVYRVMEIPFPSSVIIRAFGTAARSDMLAYGVDYDLVKNEIFKGYSFSYKRGSTNVPFVVPKVIIEGYNLAFARGQGTPSVSENMIKGLVFTFYAGKSSFRSLASYITVEGQIVGISDNVPQFGISMPINAAEYLSKELIPDYVPNYSMLYVEVKSHEYVSSVINSIRKMGFIVETSTEKTVFVESIKGFVSQVILGLVILVGIFALVSVFISIMLFVFTKVDFLSLLRLLGANKVYISFAITFVVTVLVFVISLLSSFVSQKVFLSYSSFLIDSYDIVKSFIKPEYFYITNWDIWLPVIVSSVLSVLSSVIVSVRFFVRKV
ncbi:MAG: hypothetical protein ACPL4C_05425 [Brevinematia bacterium]